MPLVHADCGSMPQIIHAVVSGVRWVLQHAVAGRDLRLLHCSCHCPTHAWTQAALAMALLAVIFIPTDRCRAPPQLANLHPTGSSHQYGRGGWTRHRASMRAAWGVFGQTITLPLVTAMRKHCAVGLGPPLYVSCLPCCSRSSPTPRAAGQWRSVTAGPRWLPLSSRSS